MVDPRGLTEGVRREVSMRPSREAAAKVEEMLRRVESLEEKVGKLSAQLDRLKATKPKKDDAE